MSWFGNLATTYNRLSDIVGLPDEKGNILLPFCHMAANTGISVKIDPNGKFIHAEESKLNIVIPCTEDSAGRAGKVEYPHPLHDQLGYLALDENKRSAYISQMGKWCSYNAKVEAVYRYIVQGTLISDLLECGVKANDPKMFVRFSVASLDELGSNLWEDASIANSWQLYCADNVTMDEALCYVTGKYETIRTKHPKGINPAANGAKLVSSNDDTNYTYRGRFSQSTQANAISANASHAAHAMLRYLIATQGYRCDSQAIVAWAIDDGMPAQNPISDTLGVYSTSYQSELEKIMQIQNEINDTDYAKKFRSALSGMGNAAKLAVGKRRIAVLAVDAATTGRMAVTFYRELSEGEYIDRIVAWHQTCRWWFWRDGVAYTAAPSTDRIIAVVFGEPKGEGYDKLKKQGRERVLHCVFSGEKIGKGWIDAAVQRVSNPFSYNKTDGGWDKYKWENAINATCAIARKYYIDKGEKVFLELNRTVNDRSYLYGRLLAVADKIESHARYLQTGGSDVDKRPTNAVRYMSAFAAKPFRTWKVIFHQILPHLQRLDGGDWYRKQIDEIMSTFNDGDYETDSALDGKYLMGYSLQRRMLNNNDREAKNDVK